MPCWFELMKGQAENHPAVDMDPSTPFKRRGPVSRLKDFIAPTDDMHVLAHLGVARVDPRQWRLRIDGIVRWPLVFQPRRIPGLPGQAFAPSMTHHAAFVGTMRVKRKPAAA